MSNKIHAEKIATLVLELEDSLAVESVNKEVMEKPLLEYLNREFPVVSANHQQLHAQIDLSNKEAAGEVLKTLLMMVNAKDGEIRVLKNDVKINHEYAAHIARHINVKFYPENTGFSPMADLYSVLSQIDNAVARVDRDAGRGQLPPLTEVPERVWRAFKESWKQSGTIDRDWLLAALNADRQATLMEKLK